METASATHPPTILPSRQAAASVRRIPSSDFAPRFPTPISSPSKGHVPCGPTGHRWTRCGTTLRRSAKYGHPSNHWSANGRRLELTTDRAVDGYRTVHPIRISGGSEGKPCGSENENAVVARRGNGIFKTQRVMIVDADEEGYVFRRVVTTPGCHEQQQGVTDLSVNGGAGKSSSAVRLVGSGIRGRTAKGVGRRERETSGELNGTDKSLHRSTVSVWRSMDSNEDCLRSEFFGGLERAARLSRRRKRSRRKQEETEGGTEEGNSTKLDLLEDKENRIYDDGPYSRELLRTSTTISLLPIEVGSLSDATAVISNVMSDASMYQETSSNEIFKGDEPEVVSTSPVEARIPRFSKYTSSAKSSRKRTITESGINGCATKRKLTRSQARLDLQHCDRRSADRLSLNDTESHLSSTPFVTGNNPDKGFQSMHQLVDVSHSAGKIELFIYIHERFLTVHVVKAKFHHHVDSYVQVSLVPDVTRTLPVQTETIQYANQPRFNKKFSFELSLEDASKWLMIVAWERSTDNRARDRIIGSTYCQVSSILRNKSVLNGWYYLHPESVSEPNRRTMQSAVNHSSSAVIPIAKSKSGYGFAVVGECPVTVSRVHHKGPADRAGLQEGDVIWRINRQNVWNFTADSIARIIRLSFDGRVVLEVLRPKQMSRDGMLGRLHYTGNQFWDESSFDSDSTINGTLNQIPCRTQ